MPVEDVVSTLFDRLGGSKPVLSSVKRLIGSEGLGGLVNRFTEAGHSGKAASWVGTGANEPLTADEVVQTLGDEKVGEAAREAGITPAEAAAKLADAIPKVVDELTPAGKLPEEKVVGELVGKL